MDLPDPIPRIAATLARARFNRIVPGSWQIDHVWRAAFENQAVVTKIEYVENPERDEQSKLPTPTMGGIPYSVNGYLPEGTAVLIDAAGNIIKILRLEGPNV